MNEPGNTTQKRGAGARLTGLIGAIASLIAILSWLGLRPPALPSPGHAAKKAAVHRNSPPAARTQPLDTRLDAVAGAWMYHAEKVSLSGRVFDGYGQLTAATPFVTFDVQGWDTFTCVVGVNDNHGDPAPAFDVQFEVDGAKGSPRRLQAGDPLVLQKIRLTGARSLTLRCLRALHPDGTPYPGELTDLIFAQPTLAANPR